MADEERRIAEALRDLTDRDATFDDPPPEIWTQIEAAVSRPAPSAARRSRELARPLVGLAALVAVIALVAGIVALAGEEPEPVAARATLSASGLPAGPSGADGSARIVGNGDDRHLELTVEGLPPAQGFYEVWLLGADLRTFQPLGSVDGSGDLLVPRGLDLARFPIVDVSHEALDGDPSHNGRSVLRGRLTQQ
jgi:Anti-sigma-K factor rskA